MENRIRIFVGKNTRPLLVAAGFAVIGVVVLLGVNAATNFLSLEPEDGTTDGVTIGTGNDASGGKYVQFDGSSPNIVYIMVDDMDTKLIPYMSKLKQLVADQGTTFENYFLNVAVCCPSRATALRGQFSQNSGVEANSGVNGGYSAFYNKGNEDSTVGVWLKDAGYSTSFIGKYMNGYMKGEEPVDESEIPGPEGESAAALPETHTPKGWTDWYGFDGGGYDAYKYEVNHNGVIINKGTAPEDYATDVMAGYAQDFLKSSATANTPFYLSIHPFAPHSPFTAADRHKDLYLDAKYPHNPNFNEEDVSDKVSEAKDLPQLTQRQIDQRDTKFMKRIQSLQAVDEMLEGIVATLEQQGKLDNTYIVLSSDNGFQFGEHRILSGKLTAYDEAIRVPMIMRGPGVAKNVIKKELVGNVDLAPTFADAAGVTPPAFVDGRSMLPLAMNQATPWRNAYLIHRAEYGSGPFWGVRTEKYSYAEYESGGIELYDLQADPYQLENMINSAPASLKDKLHTAVEGLKTCAAATCRQKDIVDL